MVNPERNIPEEATKIHGYTNSILEKEANFKEIANELMEFISGKKLIIHNAPFDISFLNHELKKINMKLIDGEKMSWIPSNLQDQNTPVPQIH